MACEQEFMYQAYLAYLARRQGGDGEPLTAEEQEFLTASGFSCEAVPEPEPEPALPVKPFASMRTKAT
jgi:hypothetical protein